MEAREEYDKLIWPIMTSCRMFACWPEAMVPPWRLAHRGLVLFFMALMCFGTSTEVAVFWGEDMNETIECSLITSAFYIALLRVLVFASRQKEMLYIVDVIRRDWTESGPEERRLLRDECILAYKLAKIFIISVAVTSIIFIAMPILELKLHPEETKKILAYRGYFFFNYTSSPLFECSYAVTSMFGILGCSTIAGATSFILISTIHGAAKFSIVQKDFSALNTLSWQTCKKVGKCIRRHQQCIEYVNPYKDDKCTSEKDKLAGKKQVNGKKKSLITFRFAETVEGVINFLALAQFVISSGLLCFAGFQLTTMMEDRTRLMKYSSFLNAAMMALFIFSYSGQRLKTESEDVAEFAYSSNWIGSLRCANMQLVMMRSRKPCTITAGKFYDMSLESFLKVLSTSFSYFTVLVALKEE